MGTVWFRGVYQDNVVLVATHTNEAENDCRRIGLSAVNGTPDFTGFTHRKGFLADGLVEWYEKPDPAAVARRKREQQERQKQEQEKLRQEKEKLRQEKEKLRQEKLRQEKLRREKLKQEKLRQEKQEQQKKEFERQRKLRQQLARHNQQESQDRQIIESAEEERIASQILAEAQMAQREQTVTQTLAALQQALDALSAHTTREDAEKLAQEQESAAQARAERLANLDLRAAALRNTLAQQQNDTSVGSTAGQELANALGLHQSKLDALEAVVANHLEAESQMLANEAHAEEMERLERSQIQTQVHY